ncbi:hypothetical protein CANARDRAFT_26034 [[Candida] arabinofermentans NRRL YB-2248]|uniref:CBS domain-containing protein n=1 Tax=[Candida] arabinofermentans NRRL YB-2248 TaxID=983967 RepID=A0A1E4T7W3_9ASCO|nr:hypothetical protein CANARDRAFT_26034 [[Candida] arabinofermentans NRRL YB-2248]
MTSNKFPTSPSMRAPNSPRPQARQTSIVEMLSTPPPLDYPSELGSIDAYMNQPMSPGNQSFSLNSSLPSGQQQSLSRNPSISSNASSFMTGTSTEWQDIPLSELVEQNKLITINSNVSVEQAFTTLTEHNLTSVPVEEYPEDPNCLTFDYTDLNSYLLLVLNKLKVESSSSINYEPKEEIPELIMKAQKGEQVPVSFVIKLTNKNPFLKLTESDTLATVAEILGTGVHRVAITKQNKLTGILSQRRMVKYLWDNARRFPSMEPLLNSSLASLNIGSSNVVTIFGDQILIEALVKMHDLMISSLAVVDRNYNLLGNISVTDVRLVSTSSKSDLLYKSCLHFISVILNDRGLENGKDSFPIFHVTTSSSFGRSIAKLVATRAHRLWIVKPEVSPSNIAPASPVVENKILQTPLPSSLPMHSSQASISSQSSTGSSSHSTPISSPVAPDKGESRSSGKLVGVLSLTDVLSILAKTLGKDHIHPSLARKQRRRSSSSSSRTNSSLEQFRKSISNANDRH